jgi:hypothetical protein
MLRPLAAALLIVVPFMNIGQASAEAPLQSVVSNHQISASVINSHVDRTCPWSGDFSKMPEGRWTQRRVYGTAAGHERLYLSVCVINSTGHGGAGYNGGAWTITRRDGTVSGVVTDGYETQLCCPGQSVQRITLVATSGTGSFENATGTLYAWSCNDEAGLRLTPKKHWGC